MYMNHLKIFKITGAVENLRKKKCPHKVYKACKGSAHDNRQENTWENNNTELASL